MVSGQVLVYQLVKMIGQSMEKVQIGSATKVLILVLKVMIYMEIWVLFACMDFRVVSTIK